MNYSNDSQVINNSEENEDGEEVNYDQKIKKLKNEIKILKSIKNKYYLLSQENEKNKKTINELNNEINVLTSLNQNKIENNEIKEKNDNIDNNNNNYFLREEEICVEENINLDPQNKIINNYKTFEEENKSLKEEIKDLKNQIKQLSENKKSENDENEEDVISKLYSVINDKESKINSLEEQLNEYKKKTNEIMVGNSNEDKNKKIEMLIKEINSLRAKILNDISYNNRITNFYEFIQNIEIINGLNSENIDPDIQDAFTKINELIKIYKENDEKIINRLVEEIVN